MNPGLTLLALALAPAQLSEEFYQDFRGGAEPTPALKASGPEVAKVLKPERGGLRITLPEKRKVRTPIVLSPQFAVSGDFEITASYEVIQAEKPTEGFGVGATIHIVTTSSTNQTATLAHYTRAKEGNCYFVNSSKKDTDGKVENHVRTFPANEKRGKLRLARQGGTVHYLVASGSSDSFQEIHQAEVGRDDLKTIRFAANTGGSGAALDMRWLEISVRSSRLPNVAAVASPRAIWWIAAVGGIGISLACVFQFWRRQRGQEFAPATDAADDETDQRATD